jgi:Uma2 family endonuclease
MATVLEVEASPETFADLLKQIGDVPLDRIRARPAPGTATEKDVIAAYEAPRKRICELVDGVLVEKAMGWKESMMACHIIQLILNFLEDKDLGIVLGEAGMLRLRPGLVRIPDVSFISFDRMTDGELPDAPIPDLVADLAVEVLSKSNTKKEIKRKIHDYFLCGVQLVWVIQPKTQTAEVYTSPTDVRRLDKNQMLDGGDVLPGFTLPLRRVFDVNKRRKS